MSTASYLSLDSGPVNSNSPGTFFLMLGRMKQEITEIYTWDKNFHSLAVPETSADIIGARINVISVGQTERERHAAFTARQSPI